MINFSFQSVSRSLQALLLASSVFGLCMASSHAADLPSKKMPKTPAVPVAAPELADVPGDDIFGYTSPTDVGKVADRSFYSENDGHLGKKTGSYFALSSKNGFNQTIAENWVVAGSVFVTGHHISNVTDLDNRRSVNFDGASFEVTHRIIERSEKNPFAVTLSLEPRYGRVDGTTGQQLQSVSAEAKLFVDAVITPDKLFWAFNANWAPANAQEAGNTSHWVGSASTNLSTAVTWQVSPNLFVGGETRLLASFGRPLLSNEQGYAVYAGPTLLWKFAEKAAFNVTYQPQVTGHSTVGTDSRLDLDNFERAQFRAKLVFQF